MSEPAIAYLAELEDLDPWAKAERIVERLAAEADAVARSAPECRTAIAYGAFRVKAEREITALLERIRELEERLEGGRT